MNYGGFTCASAPHASNKGNLYFQGTDSTVWKADLLNPATNSKMGNFQCSSTPVTTAFGQDGYLYFQVTNNALWQVPAS